MKLLKTIKEDLSNSFTVTKFKGATKLFFLPISNIIKLHNLVTSYKFEKLLKVIESIEDIKVNDKHDVMIEFKNSFVLKSEGHQIYYTKDGRIISSATMVSDNPEFNLKPYLDEMNIKSLAKKDNDLYIFYMTKYIDFSKFKFREKKDLKC